jgi:hypothetical protein
MKKIEKTKTDFAAVYQHLQAILNKYETGKLKAHTDVCSRYELIGPPMEATRGRECWFGAVRIGKAYVSFHLMPVYAFPELLQSVSPELKKRMQGKSCFNFKSVDVKLFQELAELTKMGFERFKQAKLIP